LLIFVSCGGKTEKNQMQSFAEDEFEEIDELEILEQETHGEIEPGEIEEEIEILQADTEPPWMFTTPYLVRLETHNEGISPRDSKYITFAEDGTIEVASWISGNVFTLNKPASPVWEVNDLEELQEMQSLADSYSWGINDLIYAENGTYFFLRGWHGDDSRKFFAHEGGSGEIFYSKDMAHFFSVNTDGEFNDLGNGAIHIIWHNGYFYFVDMEDGLYSNPGIGSIARMDMNGENKTTLVPEATFGIFSIANERIFFLHAGIAYSVDLNGNDKQPAGEKIAPNGHRVWLEFYDGVIINRSWLHSGYNISSLYISYGHSQSAIMSVHGCCLITFPPELRGYDPFTVIAYGYDPNFEPHYYLVLQSNYDESFWVYHKSCRHPQ